MANKNTKKIIILKMSALLWMAMEDGRLKIH